MGDWESSARVLQEMHFLEWKPRGIPSNKMSVTELEELNGALYWYRCLTRIWRGVCVGLYFGHHRSNLYSPRTSGASKGERPARKASEIAPPDGNNRVPL